MKEVWKDIEGYEGLYQVSNLGRIRSYKILKPRNRKGYMTINLYKDGKSKTLFVHRLVAQSFIDNPDNKAEVNHIDCNKTNNFVDNLEWVTGKENMQHAIKNGLIKRKENPNRTAIAIIMDDEIVFESMYKCAKHLGVDKSEIRKAINGIYRTVHGHTFRRLYE